MKTDPLKDARCQVRMPDSLYKDAEKVAEAYGTTVSTLARFLIQSFVKATKENENQVFYPPKFHTFESIKIQEEIDERDRLDPANESSKQKAG